MRPATLRLCALALLLCGPGAAGTTAQVSEAEFRTLAARLAAARLAGTDTPEAAQEQALRLLDAIVLEALHAPGDLLGAEALNQRLARLVVQQPPLGEGYRAVRLGQTHRTVALEVNFGLAGPSAVRLYAPALPTAAPGEAPRYQLVGRIDRFSHPDFFDESLVLLPVAPEEGVFVTVSGRTDELKTGVFTAWRFHQGRLAELWSSDLLQQSSYEVSDGRFILRYCGEPDEEQPRVCRRMTEARYAWEHGAWTTPAGVAPAKPQPGALP